MWHVTKAVGLPSAAFRRLAEFWLARMHAFEATFGSEPGSPLKSENRTARTESGTQDSAVIAVRPLVVVPSPAASPLVANHVGIRERLLTRRGR